MRRTILNIRFWILCVCLLEFSRRVGANQQAPQKVDCNPKKLFPECRLYGNPGPIEDCNQFSSLLPLTMVNRLVVTGDNTSFFCNNYPIVSKSLPCGEKTALMYFITFSYFSGPDNVCLFTHNNHTSEVKLPSTITVSFMVFLLGIPEILRLIQLKYRIYKLSKKKDKEFSGYPSVFILIFRSLVLHNINRKPDIRSNKKIYLPDEIIKQVEEFTMKKNPIEFLIIQYTLRQGNVSGQLQGYLQLYLQYNNNNNKVKIMLDDILYLICHHRGFVKESCGNDFLGDLKYVVKFIFENQQLFSLCVRGEKDSLLMFPTNNTKNRGVYIEMIFWLIKALACSSYSFIIRKTMDYSLSNLVLFAPIVQQLILFFIIAWYTQVNRLFVGNQQSKQNTALQRMLVNYEYGEEGVISFEYQQAIFEYLLKDIENLEEQSRHTENLTLEIKRC